MLTQVTLTKNEQEKLQALMQRTGKTEEEILHEALANFLKSQPSSQRLALLRQAQGIWKERTDLVDFQQLREEFNRIP